MSRRKGELGVESFCFGEYKCTQCNRIWESSKAWRDYGQKCKHCDKIVNATGLEELFNYICKPCYNRTKGKEGRWKYKLCKEGRSCRSCGENVKPFLTYSEFIKAKRLWDEGPNHIDPKKQHKMKLCEKCIRLGRYCRDSISKVEPQSKVEFTYYKINKTTTTTSQYIGINEENGDNLKVGSSTKTGGISTGVTSELSFRQVASIGIIKPSCSTSEISYNSSTGKGNTSTLPSKTDRSGFRTISNSSETTPTRLKDDRSTSGYSRRVESTTNTGNEHIHKNTFLASQEGTFRHSYQYGHNSRPVVANSNDQAGVLILLVIGVLIICLLCTLEKFKENARI